MKNRVRLFVFLLALTPYLHVEAGRAPAAFAEKKFNLNVQNATLHSVLRLIAERGGLEPQIEGDFSSRVSYNFKDMSLEAAMGKIAADTGLKYSIEEGNILKITKVVAVAGTKTPKTDSDISMIKLKFLDVDETLPKLLKYIHEGDDLQSDKKSNAILFQGSVEGLQRVQKVIELLDTMPKQILIEAKIVESNDTFSREIGLSMGDISDKSLANTSVITGFASTVAPAASSANFGLKYKMGTMEGRALELRLTAAETRGEAKVISRPRVVTIDNTKATINSGIVFNVKTLTTQNTTTSSGDSSAVTGGVEQLTAGLELNVLPKIVGDDIVRLIVDVNNSEPNNAYQVDGIPGITNNAANTSLILKEGTTAVIAGLIKNASSKTVTGVPWISEIPLLGMLFRSSAKSDRNNELIIFITPRILSAPTEMEKEPVANPTADNSVLLLKSAAK